MELKEILHIENIAINVKAKSKKQALIEASQFASGVIDMPYREIFDTLLQRERLGTTGTGSGIAIPHGKLAELKQLHCFLIRLDGPVPFDALDDQPVDLMIVLLVPETAGADHLKALARIARLMRQPDLVHQIRGAETVESIYAILDQDAATHAA